MSRVQRLLAGAWIPDGDRVPQDVVPIGGGPGRPRVPDPARDPEERRADGQLAVLCELLLAHYAHTALRSFLTDRLPEPLGARLVGCVLQLADDEDGARAWWQYAAGAEDELSPYCLHLQHRKYGEQDAAELWLDRSPVERWTGAGGGRPPGVRLAFDVTFPAMLDLLAGLRPQQLGERERDAVVEALLEYIPHAVAPGHARYPAFDLPVPGPGFAERVRALLSGGPGRRSASHGPEGDGDGGGGDGRLPAHPRTEGPAEG
ncbi:hypothetical protein [Streptomyces chilikensis]|uniref:hypothetical protein n=1 Tax=Streptomyces chilikensis TaxID=1194079 RepID=UPI001407CDA0|nr:hypothetical protein [Streptomyces chilikensis]